MIISDSVGWYIAIIFNDKIDREIGGGLNSGFDVVFEIKGYK